MDVNVTIIDSDPASRARLQAALTVATLEGCRVVAPEGERQGVCLWVGPAHTAPQTINENDIFTKPVRLGAVLDRVKRHLKGGKAKAAKKIVIGPYELDEASGELLDDDDRAIRLTDKEKQILVLLAGSGTVGREEMLEKVWGYAQGLETHTLETHIYRLRQKIEKDPGKPDILLTDGAGYRLK